MTGEQLREELERIAAGAPPVHVPDDLFARGRRATIRARALAGAAAVACLALVAAVTVPLSGSDEGTVADRDEPGGVPDVIYAPPDADLSELPEVAVEEVGPAVAAYLVDTQDGRIVVVTEDGRYVASRLPGYRDAAFDPVSPALSPDGRRIAWTSRRDDAQTLAIVDLDGGDVRHVQLADPHGATVRTLQWSPDGRWLAWSGQAVAALRDNGASYRSRIIGGVISSDTARSRAVPDLGRRWDGAGVCDDGTPVTFAWPRFASHDGRPTSGSWERATSGHGECTAPATYLAVERERELIGWLPGTSSAAVPTAVALTPVFDEDEGYDHFRLELVTPNDTRTVGTVEASWLANLSVATGLMSADDPTAPAGQNPWEKSWWERSRLPLAILGVLAFLGVVAGLAVGRVRRPVRG